MRFGRTAELLCAGVICVAGLNYVLIPPGGAASKWASSSQMIQSEFTQNSVVQPLSPSAARVALTALSMSDDGVGSNAFSALTMAPTAEIDLGSVGVLQVAILDDDTRDIARELFAVNGSAYSPVILDRGDREATVAVNYQRPFVTQGEAGELDVTITPHAAVSMGSDGSAAGAGAEVRVGQYLSHRLRDRPSWYFFAGADRRALLYDPAEGMDFDSALYLTRREVMGDMQAGLAMRVGAADLSVAYVRREYRHIAGVTAFDETENFGALTVNWTW
jgi:hypothetical protein